MSDKSKEELEAWYAEHRAQEAAKQQREADRLTVLAEHLPALLEENDRWSADLQTMNWSSPRLVLVRDDTAEIHVQTERLAPSRWGLWTVLPDKGPYWPRGMVTDRGAITVTKAKTPEQVAVDVRRRLLPALNAAMVKVSQLQMEHARKVADVDFVVALLAEVKGVQGGELAEWHRRDGRDQQRELSWNRSAGFGHPRAQIRVQTYPGLHVKIEADHLPPETARSVLALLQREWQARRPPGGSPA